MPSDPTLPTVENDAADDVRAVCLELPDGTRYYCPAAAFRDGTISPLPGHSWRVTPPGVTDGEARA